MFDDGTPIYLQIADRIRDEILRGELAEDGPVMSTNEYAAFFRINPATVGKAFHLLVDDGLLYKRRGIGMFVSPDARSRLRDQRRARFFDVVVDPMLDEAEAIGIALEDIAAHIDRTRGAHR